jgi:hypothetical protein
MQFLKHFRKYLLDQIFLGRSTGQLSPDNAPHKRRQVFYQCTGGILVPQAYAGDAIGNIEIQVLHEQINPLCDSITSVWVQSGLLQWLKQSECQGVAGLITAWKQGVR